MLNAGIAEALQSIHELKSLVVRTAQYEYAAKLWDIEKHLCYAENMAAYLPNPIKIPEVETFGGFYEKYMFDYGNLHLWVLPNLFTNDFMERKAALNRRMEFDHEKTWYLVELNKKLTSEENRISEFLNYIDYVVKLKFDAPGLERFITGNLTLKCGTTGGKYTIESDNIYDIFYSFTFPAITLLNSKELYYDTPIALNTTDNKFLNPLPLKLREEKICFLFYLLAKDGLLAWEDFLHISRVELVMGLKYGLGVKEVID